MNGTFAGFFELTGNFTMVPNDALYYMAAMSGAEFKCLMYIIRHTFGFHDRTKAITLDEFANGRKRKDGSRLDLGTGLSRSTIVEALGVLIEQGYVVRYVDDIDKARVIHSFGLNMHESSEASDFRTPAVGNSDAGGSIIGRRSEKETSETNRGKGGAPSARALHAALSQVTPGERKPRGEEERTSWALSDPDLPDICKVLWRVFSPINGKLKVSAKQRAELEAPVVPRGSHDSYASPDDMYKQYPVAFEVFLTKLKDWMLKKDDVTINMTNIIRFVRGYDYNGIGWFNHMPKSARQTASNAPASGNLDALQEFISG